MAYQAVVEVELITPHLGGRVALLVQISMVMRAGRMMLRPCHNYLWISEGPQQLLLELAL